MQVSSGPLKSGLTLSISLWKVCEVCHRVSFTLSVTPQHFSSLYEAEWRTEIKWWETKSWYDRRGGRLDGKRGVVISLHPINKLNGLVLNYWTINLWWHIPSDHVPMPSNISFFLISNIQYSIIFCLVHADIFFFFFFSFLFRVE